MYGDLSEFVIDFSPLILLTHGWNQHSVLIPPLTPFTSQNKATAGDVAASQPSPFSLMSGWNRDLRPPAKQLGKGRKGMRGGKEKIKK